jgi:hypothetical protein
MRTILAALALSLVAGSASAAPHRKPHRQRDTAWVRTCIHERTGPEGGIPVAEARAICLAEQPDDEVSAAKQQLTIARANARVAKAKERAHRAIEACEQAIVDSCFAALPDGKCEDTDLTTAFAVCH